MAEKVVTEEMQVRAEVQALKVLLDNLVLLG